MIRQRRQEQVFSVITGRLLFSLVAWGMTLEETHYHQTHYIQSRFPLPSYFFKGNAKNIRKNERDASRNLLLSRLDFSRHQVIFAKIIKLERCEISFLLCLLREFLLNYLSNVYSNLVRKYPSYKNSIKKREKELQFFIVYSLVGHYSVACPAACERPREMNTERISRRSLGMTPPLLLNATTNLQAHSCRRIIYRQALSSTCTCNFSQKLKWSLTEKNEITKEKRLFSPFYFLFRRSEIPPRGERPTKPELAQFLSTVVGNIPRPRSSLDRCSSRYLHVVPEMSLWCLFESWLSSEPLSEYPQKSLYVRFRLLVFSDLIAFSFFCAAWIRKIIYNDH